MSYLFKFINLTHFYYFLLIGAFLQENGLYPIDFQCNVEDTRPGTTKSWAESLDILEEVGSLEDILQEINGLKEIQNKIYKGKNDNTIQDKIEARIQGLKRHMTN